MIRETGRTLRYAGLIAEGKWEEIGNLLFESYGDSKDFFAHGGMIENGNRFARSLQIQGITFDVRIFDLE